MINVIQSWMLNDIVVEKDVHEARAKAKLEIVRVLSGEPPSGGLGDAAGVHPGIVYDEDGAPRPARMAYNGAYSDDPPMHRPVRVQPLPPETVPTDDYDNPFPGLDPPVG